MKNPHIFKCLNTIFHILFYFRPQDRKQHHGFMVVTHNFEINKIKANGEQIAYLHQ